jgi:tetratricopeptide (TPR) repeat protein
MLKSVYLAVAVLTVACTANSNASPPSTNVVQPPPAEKAALTTPTAPVAANGGTAPAPTEPAGSSTAQAIANAAALQAIGQVSERAIDAAHHSSTEANELFEKLVWFVGVLGVVFAAFGISTLRSLKRELLAKAREQVKEALFEVNAKAKEQVSEALLGMKSQIDSAVSQTTQTAECARDVLLNIADATRLFSLARSFVETEFDKREYLESALQACLRAREAAEKLKDTKQVAWTYSFEAYCRREKGDYEGAASVAEKSEALYKRDDPTLHYNLACYLCLAGHDARAEERLRLAISINTDGAIKGYALTERDFDRWRQAGMHPELVGARPEKVPEPAPTKDQG